MFVVFQPCFRQGDDFKFCFIDHELEIIKYLCHWRCVELTYLHMSVEFLKFYYKPEAATVGVLWKKVFLEISQNSQENTCARDSFLIKVSGTGFSCEICEISKNTFFTEYLQMTASDKRVDVFVNNIFDQCSIQFLQLNIEKS